MSTESVKSQGERLDLDLSSSDTASVNQQSVYEAPDAFPHHGLPSLEEEALRHAASFREQLQEKCCNCLVRWKTSMLVRQLCNMGFQSEKAVAAVNLFGSNIERAIKWLIDSPDLQESQTYGFGDRPSAEICIELELQNLLQACQQHHLEVTTLQKAVIQHEGDLNAAISSLIKSCHSFPDCDLSLGLLTAESPCIDTAKSMDTLSDDLMLESVLGKALDEYKSGHADFTDLANKAVMYQSSPMSIIPDCDYFYVQGEVPVLSHFIGDLME